MRRARVGDLNPRQRAEQKAKAAEQKAERESENAHQRGVNNLHFGRTDINTMRRKIEDRKSVV